MATGEIDNLVISVTSSANEATRALSRVRDAMRGVQGAADDASGSTGVMSDQMEHVAGGSQRAHIRLSGFLTRVKSLGGPLKSIGGKLAGFGGKIVSSMAELQKVFGALQNRIKGIQKSLSIFGNRIKTVTSRFLPFAKLLNSKLGEGIKRLPGLFGDKLFGSVKRAVTSLDTFFSSLKRIAFYRAIRTALKLITQGFSEGIENLYRWSVLVDNRFAKSMDTIATAGQYLKNSLAAMVSPLINAIAPAIDFVVDKLVNVFNAVNQVIARLTGAATYTAAKKVATVWKDTSEDVADKTKTAAKNAKETNDELKRTILGFDEINKLDKQSEPNTGTSSPGTGTGNGDGKKTDYASMFETRKIDSKLANFADQIRKAIRNQDWEGVGAILADKLNGLVDKIEWEKLGTRLGKRVNALVGAYNGFMERVKWFDIGKGLADGLNGLIGEIKWDELGRAFVQKLNALVRLLYGFVTNFKWGEAGVAFGTMFNSIVDNIEWETLRKAIIAGLVGIVKMIRNMVATFEWGKHGETFSDNILKLADDFPATELGNALSTLLSKALLMMNKVFENRLIFTIIGRKLAQFLNSVFSNRELWIQLGQTVNNLLIGILTFGQGFLDEFKPETAAANIKLALHQIKWGEIASETWTMLKTAFQKAGSFMDVLFADDSTSTWDIWEKRYIPDDSSLATKIGKRISKAVSNIPWKNFGSFLSSAGSKLFDAFSDFFMAVNDENRLQNAITEFFAGFSEHSSELVESAVQAMWSFIDSLGHAIVGAIWERVKYHFDNLIHGRYDVTYQRMTSDPRIPITKEEYDKAKTGGNVQVGGLGGSTLSSARKKLSGSATSIGGINITVNAQPGNGLKLVQGGDLALKQIPSGETNATVNLLKNGWTTVSGWVNKATGGNSKQKVELRKWGWSFIDRWANQYKGDNVGANVSLVRWGWSWVSDWVSQYAQTPVDQGINLYVENWGGFLGGIQSTLHSWFPNLFAAGGILQNGKVSRFARGGAIEAYAGGTARTHGSLFLAGEAGPEIVGHVGGRTEVLNKSQIAATMFEAVRAAMTGISIDASVYDSGIGPDGNEAMLELIMEGNSATQREIEILREQNNILRQLLEKPLEANITSNAIVRAMQLKNKRDGTTVVPVY